MEPTPEERIARAISEAPAKVPGTDPTRSKPLTSVESVELLEKAGVPVPPSRIWRLAQASNTILVRDGDLAKALKGLGEIAAAD